MARAFCIDWSRVKGGGVGIRLEFKNDALRRRHYRSDEACGRSVMPGNHCYAEVAAQNRNNAKDNEWAVRRTGGILTYTEDQKEHAGNTNSGREVKGDGDVPSKIGMDTNIMAREAALISLFVCE